MKCDVCQNEKATIFLGQLVDGNHKKIGLCQSCADEKDVTNPTGFELAEKLDGMGEETATDTAVITNDLTCASCGFTQTDFKKTGRFGCADCYQVFDDGLDGLLEAMHKHTRHEGKKPATFEASEEVENGKTEPLSPVDQLNELKFSLAKAVEDEDYEEAARLRDQISQIESQVEDS